MQVVVDGSVGAGVTAKDIALAIIGKIGTAGGTAYSIEFAGSAIRALSMEGRMTLCNMAIEPFDLTCLTRLLQQLMQSNTVASGHKVDQANQLA